MSWSRGASGSPRALSLITCCVNVFLLDTSELFESELEKLESEDALEDDEYRRENLDRLDLFPPLLFEEEWFRF